MMPSAYIVRIFKSWGSRDADRRWSNTYEISHTGGTPVAAVGAIDELVQMERKLHLAAVKFLSATISTWLPDSVPYNPESFTTVELSTEGLRGTSTGIEPSALDSNVCLMTMFTPASGRSGRRFYRGVLLEGDVMMGGDGRATFDPAGPFMTGTDFAAFATAAAPMLSAGASATKIQVISNGGLARNVVAVSRGRVVVNRRNHRYFDRAVG